MTLREILVPYDNSSFAKRAFKHALNIAQKQNSRITVVIVIKEEYPPIVGFSKLKLNLMKAHQQAAKKQIKSLESSAKKLQIPFSSKIKQGTSIVKEIINFSETRKFDLIVMGSHGRTGFKRLMLGSVANGVIHSSKIPVLIVK